MSTSPLLTTFSQSTSKGFLLYPIKLSFTSAYLWISAKCKWRGWFLCYSSLWINSLCLLSSRWLSFSSIEHVTLKVEENGSDENPDLGSFAPECSRPELYTSHEGEVLSKQRQCIDVLCTTMKIEDPYFPVFSGQNILKKQLVAF